MKSLTFLGASESAILSVEERRARGKELRTQAPRSSHADWSPDPARPDPIGLLEESNKTRFARLVPIRYGRMSLSPFAFLRGSAAIMACDLAKTPISGITAQICGDAHLLNFGTYATPERRQVFDVNDFDETLAGPWEWDIKRLAASVVVAGRQNGFSAQANKQGVVQCVQAYRTHMNELGNMGYAKVWYSTVKAEETLQFVQNRSSQDLNKALEKARQQTNVHIFPKLVRRVEGNYRNKRESFLDYPSGRGQTDRAITGFPERLLRFVARGSACTAQQVSDSGSCQQSSGSRKCGHSLLRGASAGERSERSVVFTDQGGTGIGA